MGIFDLFGKRDVASDLGKQAPYGIKIELIPYKLRANQRSSSMLVASIKNMTIEPVMGSIVIEVPKQLSLDQTGMATQKEVRLGMMAANEEKQQRIDIYSDIGTDKGEYTVTLTAFVHYRDYGHVLNAVRKRYVIESV